MDDLVPRVDPAPVVHRLPRHLRPRTRLANALHVGGVFLGLAAIGLLFGTIHDRAMLLVVPLVWGLQSLSQRRQAKRTERFLQSTRLLGDGETEAAKVELDALCRANGVTPRDHALFVFFRAVAELHCGDVRRAQAMLLATRDSAWFLSTEALVSYRCILHGHIATAHARLGEHELAAQSLAQAHLEVSLESRGILLVADAIVLARAGRHREALDRIELDSCHAERQLSIRRIRVLRVLRAFCEHAIAHEYRAPAIGSDVYEATQDVASRGVLECLSNEWPELRAFVAAHANA